MNYSFFIILVPVILFSLTIHEYAHALVAYRLGDDTAKRQGRLSLNPLVHLDLLGTLLLFIVHFGWAKPVPVDPRNFRNPKKDMLLVALAGPVSNILTAIAAAVIGGGAITGGTGSALGAALGAGLLGLVYNALILLKISSYWHPLFVGLLILGAATLDTTLRRR